MPSFPAAVGSSGAARLLPGGAPPHGAGAAAHLGSDASALRALHPRCQRAAASPVHRAAGRDRVGDLRGAQTDASVEAAALAPPASERVPETASAPDEGPRARLQGCRRQAHGQGFAQMASQTSCIRMNRDDGCVYVCLGDVVHQAQATLI